jgi:hypothetical protein
MGAAVAGAVVALEAVDVAGFAAGDVCAKPATARTTVSTTVHTNVRFMRWYSSLELLREFFRYSSGDDDLQCRAWSAGPSVLFRKQPERFPTGKFGGADYFIIGKGAC